MKQQVYLLNNKLKGIGRGGYPQVQQMSLDYDYDAYNSVHKLHPEKFPDFTPNFDSMVLRDGATPTDLLSTSPIPYYVLVLSEKLLDILTKFKLPPFKVYSVSVVHKGKKLNGYNALHILDPKEHLNYIHFERSKFQLVMTGHEGGKVLKLSSHGDLQAEMERLRVHNTTTNEPALGIWAEELILRDDFYELVDLFFLSVVTFPVHAKITNKIKSAVEKEGCTGIEFGSVSGDKNELFDPFWKKIVNTYFP